MPDHQPRTMTCPACGAPLEFDGSSTTSRCKFCSNVTYVPVSLPASVSAPRPALGEVRRLAENGNLLEAIKQYRLLTGAGLKDAKDAVEALRDGRLAERVEDLQAVESADLERVLDEIRELLRSGDKIEAIHKYRETYDVSLARAKFAVEQIAAGGTVEPGGEFLSPGSTTREGPATDQTGSRLGCFIVTAILLIVGGILAFALAQPGGPFVPRLIPNGPAILLPSEQDAPPDVVSVFYDPDREVRVIGRIGADGGKLLWSTDPLDDGSYTDAIVQGDGRVYVAHGPDLLAFNRTDGGPAWQASMSDKVYNHDSLAFYAGRVIALGLDQTLQAFEAESGRLVWSRPIGGYDRLVRLIDGSFVVIDHIDQDNNFGMIFLDPVDGREQRVLAPVCPYNEFSPDSIRPDSGMIYDEAEKALFLVYGSFGNCIQRLDLAGGQIAWSVTSDDGYSFSPYGFHGLLTGTTLYFGSENRLLAVDKTSGEVRVVLEDEGYEFLPLAVGTDQLFVRARRSRGSERFELWGVDLAGGRTWQIGFGKAKPVDPPNEMSGVVDRSNHGWTMQPRPGGLLWLEFQADPNQIVFRTIDLAGSASDEHTLPLKLGDTDYYTVPEVIGWQGRVVYFVLDSNIYALDTSTGEMLFDY